MFENSFKSTYLTYLISLNDDDALQYWNNLTTDRDIS